MATLAQKEVRPLRRRSGGPIATAYFPEAATQVFKRGELVYLDATGYVAEYTAAIDDDSQRMLGVAAQDGSNDASAADSRTAVWVPDDDLIFIGSMYHGTSSSAVAAITDYATLLPFAYDTSNSRVYVDKEDNAGQMDCCRIVGIWADESHEEAIGDIYPQVMFIIEAAIRQLAQ